MAYLIELAELFDVEMDHLAGLLALISAGWLGRFQGAQPVQPQALEHPAHCRCRDADRGGISLPGMRWRRRPAMRSITSGIVELRMKKGDASKAAVWKMLHWRHRDDKPTRDQAVTRLAEMTGNLVQRAIAAKLKLAPFMGGGCPGLIDERGAILNGGQNLPGNWQEDGFNLVSALGGRLPRIDAHEPVVLIHNDAVVQGLSELPQSKDVSRWGVLTIGTGLGNARFTNRLQG